MHDTTLSCFLYSRKHFRKGKSFSISFLSPLEERRRFVFNPIKISSFVLLSLIFMAEENLSAQAYCKIN